jgi:hypothetical protein
MPIDPRMRAAILEATQAAGQGRSLADKIVAWFEAMSSGNESITNPESVARHMDIFYSLAEGRDVADSQDAEEEEKE